MKQARSGATVSSSPPPEPPPAIAAETPLNRGTAQLTSPPQPISSPTDRDTLTLPSPVVPEPRVIPQGQGIQVGAFTEERLLKSRKPDVMMGGFISPLNIMVTSPPEATTPHNNRPSRGEARSGGSESPPGAKPEGAPTVAPKPDAKPQASRVMEVTLPGQPQGWRV